MESIQEGFLEEVQFQCLKNGAVWGEGIKLLCWERHPCCVVSSGKNRGGKGWREAESGDKGF